MLTFFEIERSLKNSPAMVVTQTVRPHWCRFFDVYYNTLHGALPQECI